MVHALFTANLKYLALLWIVLQGVSGFAQPTPFDQKYVDSVSVLLPKMPDNKAKVDQLRLLASMHVMVNPPLTIQYANEGAAIAEKIDYPLGQIACLAQSAFSNAVRGEWVKATIDVNRAIPLCEKYDPAQLIYMNNIMVIVATTKGENEMALQYSLKAMHNPVFGSGAEISKWPTYMQLGRIYYMLNRLDSSRYYADRISGYVKKYAEMIPDLARNSYILFGNLAFSNRDYPLAIKNFHLAPDQIGLAKTYQILNEHDSAVFYAKMGLEINLIEKNPLGIQEASKILAKEYAKSDPKKAIGYLQIYSDSRDSLYNSQKLRQLEQLKLNEQENKFELAKRITADRNRFMQLSLGGVLAFFLILAMILWRNNRLKHIANQKLESTLEKLKTTQAQLIQNEKLASLGELTAGIAHEIQNPLNFVNNFAEVSVELTEELDESVSQGDTKTIQALSNDLRQNMIHIAQNGQRASDIVRNMLEHSRPTTSQAQPADLNILAEQYFKLAYQGIRSKDPDFNMELITDLDKNLGQIKLVPQDIGRVLLNLYNNAFYAAKRKQTELADNGHLPTIWLSTKRINGSVTLKVRDNGTGIPAEILSKIFQPFFTTKPTGQGTGLGLSLSYDIITKGHSGEMYVCSEPAIFTEFVICLPAN